MPEVPYVPDVLGGPDGLLDVDFGGNRLPVDRRCVHPRRTPGLEELPRLPVEGVRVLLELFVEFQHVAEVRPEKLALRLSFQPDHTLTSRYPYERRTKRPGARPGHLRQRSSQSDQTS